MMTLRQIEVIRAVMVTGTIGGAAKLLNVSAPGISRLVKYTEKSLGLRFFQRQNGRYFPTPEAQNIFEQINGVYKKVDDLSETISNIGRGALSRGSDQDGDDRGSRGVGLRDRHQSALGQPTATSATT